jgi:hypothetical protein
MVALARQITQATEKLETYMKANNLLMPSYDVDAPADFPSLPEDIQQSRQDIIIATKELATLAHGPRESVRWGIWEVIATQPPYRRLGINSPASFWMSYLLLSSTTTSSVSHFSWLSLRCTNLIARGSTTCPHRLAHQAR